MKYIIRFFSLVFRVLQHCKRRASLASAIEQGLVIGYGTRVIGDVNFGSEPYLISVGDNCLITDGVRFITHDGGIQVPFIERGFSMSEVYGGKVLADAIHIGSNVFVGNGSIILPGTSVGDNVLVGAGSVLRGNYPGGSVVAGVPARVICNTDDYYERNSSRVVEVNSRVFNVRKNILLDGGLRAKRNDV